MNNFDEILRLDGLDFIRELLKYEQGRFDNNFLSKSKSVFEEININFGIFPKEQSYPVYFLGDIKNPKDKIIFIGINPGYNQQTLRKEQKYLRKINLIDGYCHIFAEYFGKQSQTLIPYFKGIKSFWTRYKDMSSDDINWNWFQKNLINLEFIPYHSIDTGGLKINDAKYFVKRYLKPLLKILKYINPREAVFINGFPTLRKYFEQEILSQYIKIDREIVYHKGKVVFGVLNGKYKFIGLPFLNMPAGGYDNLAKVIKDYFRI